MTHAGDYGQYPQSINQLSSLTSGNQLSPLASNFTFYPDNHWYYPFQWYWRTPQPCPSCGHCPTCGNSPAQHHHNTLSAQNDAK